MNNKIQIVNNALAEHYISILRNKNRTISEFRFALDKLSTILAIEAMKGLPNEAVEIETPLETTFVKVLKTQIVIVPVLRAGLSMLSAFIDLLPEAQIGFIGQKRDEKTAIASEYYRSFPSLNNKKIIIIDPMLATGGSALATIDSLIEVGAMVKDIQLVCIIAAPEGVQNIQEKYSQLAIVAASLDRCLNDKKYILPGLGDAGDLWTGTAI
jgi:uracil phosphoribosyltransferase